MIYVYILKLQHDKYYIGKTTNIKNRIKNHYSGKGSAWTRKYKPIKVVEIKECCDNFDEDKYTKMYMSIYGIDNVRGGSYCQVKLDKCSVELIEKEIQTSNDSCFRCNKKGHFVNSCDEQITDSGKRLSSESLCCVYCDKIFYVDSDLKLHENECHKKRKRS
jgi:hypothetical protein